MSSRLLPPNVRVVSPEGVLENARVLVERGCIVGIEASSEAPSGLTLLPGFVDIHIHGGGGHDTMDAAPDALRAILRTHAKHGTTGLLLTTITQSREKISAALRAAREAYEAGAAFCPDGAQVLGIHLEGPYISAKRPGAQPKQYVRPYDVDEFAEWLDIAGDAMKLITLAPEEPNAHALIAECVRRNIVVSFGHTDATAAQMYDALQVSRYAHATHLFNAMPALHHRNPGVVGVALSDDRMQCEVICDGHHVAPEIAKLTLAAKGKAGMVLITDAMSGAGSPDGIYDLGGHAVNVASGLALLADGTLAGSVLTMAQAVRNVRAWTGADWGTLAHLSATNAADALGLSLIGRLAPGTNADMVLVDDDLAVQAVYVGGQCVYAA